MENKFEKQLLKESNVWDRKFGEKLPTLQQCADRYNKKNNIVTEGQFPEKLIRRVMDMQKNFPLDARILVAQATDKKIMKAYEGLKDISNVIVPHREIEQKLDIKLKAALEKKYTNSAEVIGNVNFFGKR